MNYQKIDAERIRKVKEAERENRVQNTWDALQYKSKAIRTAKANRTTTQSHSPVISPSKEAKAKASSIIAGTNLSSNTTKKTNNSIPKLNGMKGDPRYEAPTKPATRYRNEPAVKYEPKTTSSRDTKYDKDFAEYWDARFANHDVKDYDPVTDREVAHWENVKKDLMKKYNWSEKEFDEKFKPYNEEQWQKMNQQEMSINKGIAEASPFLGALASTMYLPEAIGEGIAGSISRLVGYKNDEFAGNDDLLATRSREAMKTIGADKVKEKAKNKIENSLVGKIAGNAVGKDKVEAVGNLAGGAASGLYNAGTGFADMAIASAVPGGIAWLGGDTAARSLLNSEERGIDERKAGLQALLSGGASAVINKVGLDKAMKGLPSLSALQNVRNAALTEAGENVLEDNVNTLLDTVLNGKKSELVTLHDYYMKQGMPSAQAWLNVAKDTGEDRIISALSGAAFGAFMSGAKNRKALVSEIEDRMQYNKRQNADIRGILGGNAAEVLARAKEAQQARLNEAAARITNTDVNPAPEAAQTPVPEAEITRPDVNSDLKQRQLDVINRTNPAPDDIHTWVRSVDDIKTFEEVWNENPNVDPDFTEEMAQEAMRTGKIKVYSSYNIEDGTFVTPSYMEALAYAGDPNNVKSAVVNLDDVAWIDTDQGQLARVNDVAPEGKITEGNVNSPQAETPQTPINRASEKNEGKIPSVDVISPSVEAAETASKKVPSLRPDTGEIKLVRNKETGEHTYGDYRVIKNGKSGYTVVDADGNSIGDARILKDAKDVIANAEGERAAELDAIKQEYEGKNFGFGENIEDVPEGPATNVVLRPEDVKLTKNTTANGGTEYSYGDYRVTKNGRWYQIKDADGNLLGESRTLNDAKPEIAIAMF